MYLLCICMSPLNIVMSRLTSVTVLMTMKMTAAARMSAAGGGHAHRSEAGTTDTLGEYSVCLGCGRGGEAVLCALAAIRAMEQ